MHWGATLVTPHVSAPWQDAPRRRDAGRGADVCFDRWHRGLAQDTALVGAGLDFARLISGQFGDSVSDNAVKGRVTWLF